MAVKLCLCSVQLNLSVYDGLQATRLRAPTRYPVVCRKIGTFAFAGDTTKFERDVFVGEIQIG